MFEIRFGPGRFTTSNGSLRILDHRGELVFAERIIEPFHDPDSRLVRIERALPPGRYVATVKDFESRDNSETEQRFEVPEGGRSSPVQIRF